MALDISVRRANLADAQAIADFVNSSRSGAPVTRQTVVERFGQVGFMIAYNGNIKLPAYLVGRLRTLSSV